MDNYVNELVRDIENNETRAIARALTLVENDHVDSFHLLAKLKINSRLPVVGITGPPGAGKSTLVNAIINELFEKKIKIAVLAVDPTSPFSHGSLLGDRIRMVKQYNNPDVFIRSIAARGSLGGISNQTSQMIDVLKASGFDLIIVETVGVGQSEVEIARLATKTILVLVPEAGDEIQHIKSGVMEIAQAFVVNKSDREGADGFANKLTKMVRTNHATTPVFKTVASKGEGIQKVCKWILTSERAEQPKTERIMVNHVYRIIENLLRQEINLDHVEKEVKLALQEKSFNAYQVAKQLLNARIKR